MGQRGTLDAHATEKIKTDQPSMKHEFPAAVPEIPVSDMNEALDYYEVKLGVNIDFNTPIVNNLSGAGINVVTLG